MSGPTVSIVVPVFNEAEVLPELYRRVTDVMAHAGVDHELLLVNDGSTDHSLQLMVDLHERDPRVSILDLSRNYGHQTAMTAGLDHARGRAVVSLDADLQDPPEVIPQMIEKWRQGYDVVYGIRERRDGEGTLKLGTAWLFYRALRWLTPIEIPVDTGDFRLMSRRAVEGLGQLRERRRFLRGMSTWIGYRQTGVLYRRAPRFAGQTKYSVAKMTRLAVDAALSFSTVPLRLSVVLGALVAGLCLIYAALTAGSVLLGADTSGSALMIAVLGVGSAQLVCLGILGEYVGRIYAEVRARPLYLVGAMHREERPCTDES